MDVEEPISPARSTAGRLTRRGFGAVALAAAASTAAPAVAAAATSPAPTAGGRPKLGFVLSHEQFPTGELVSFAAAPEHAGFASVWASDHTQPWQQNQGHSMFPWLTLESVGDHTSRLKYCTGRTTLDAAAGLQELAGQHRPRRASQSRARTVGDGRHAVHSFRPTRPAPRHRFLRQPGAASPVNPRGAPSLVNINKPCPLRREEMEPDHASRR